MALKLRLPNGMEIEGTVAELKEMLGELIAESQGEKTILPSEKSSSASVDDILYIFKRRKLSKDQRKVLSLIYDAGDRGIKYSELVKKIGLTRHQMAGVMGALGRRVAYSYEDKELSLWDHIFDCEDTDNEDFHVWLRPNARKAYEALNK